MLSNFLQEDVGAGDITSNNVIPAGVTAKAEIICKSDSAIVCGLEEAVILFDICRCTSKVLTRDGSRVKRGKVVMEIDGRARDILRAERVALNMIMRMSGIATETRRMVDLAKGVTIMATRKTAPGLRYFDKKAVVVGGGAAHRMRLDDMVLIKDNHLALMNQDPAKCVKLAKKNVGSRVKVECEVKSIEEALAAVSAGADIIMLDNFTPLQALKAIRQLTKLGLRKKVKIEISGGVNVKNIRQYARAKPDFISLGYITHSPQAVDFSLEIKK